MVTFSASKDIMIESNVPVVPGYHGENQDPKYLMEKAAEIGYPVMIKAVSGGGGKGMRIVHGPEEFLDHLESSKRESLKSFKDDRVLVEKYLSRPRHVEVQVFADNFGNVVYLHERDCSVQRRHQKILEEAPAPNLTPELRKSLGEKAVLAAKAVGYRGAGTVEFILDAEIPENFYFMEMNTRLQVEHPITEMITGQDLVAWQIIVASGLPLPLTQEEIPNMGHAFEARIYAEKPDKYTLNLCRNFLPDTGKIIYLSAPTEPMRDCHIRVETGIRENDQVSVFYDPMIAKLVVHGPTRDQALYGLRKALEEYHIVGPSTNIDFLKRLAAHPAFIKGQVETGFIEKHREDLFRKEGEKELMLAAQLGAYLASQYPKEPYAINRHFKFDIEEPSKMHIQVHEHNGGYDIKIGEKSIRFDNTVLEPTSSPQATKQICYSNEARTVYTVVRHPNDGHLDTFTLIDKDGNQTQIKYVNPDKKFSSVTSEAETQSSDMAKSPMPSRVSAIMAKQGQAVKKGSTLMVLEAMKMEHAIKATRDGTILKILPPESIGAMINEGHVLFQLEAEK